MRRLAAEAAASIPTYHLSYPVVFHWQGTAFLMPETVAAGRLEVYRCRRFPGDWELESVPLTRARLADPTLVEVEGRWWMFANAQTDPGRLWERDLHVFHGPTPLGPWTPHRRNPVKSDLGNARPAGRLFWHTGRLYRPAQDSSRGYGFLGGDQPGGAAQRFGVGGTAGGQAGTRLAVRPGGDAHGELEPRSLYRRRGVIRRSKLDRAQARIG